MCAGCNPLAQPGLGLAQCQGGSVVVPSAAGNLGSLALSVPHTAVHRPSRAPLHTTTHWEGGVDSLDSLERPTEVAEMGGAVRKCEKVTPLMLLPFCYFTQTAISWPNRQPLHHLHHHNSPACRT